MPEPKPAVDAATKAKFAAAAQKLKQVADTVKKMKTEVDAQDQKVANLDQALDQ